jgi:hypothetical protein
MFSRVFGKGGSNQKKPNVGQNFNTGELNTQVKGLVNALRQIRNAAQPGATVSNNVYMNSTKTQRDSLNKAIVKFITKYNKAVAQTSVAAAAPTPSAVVQATQTTQQAVKAATNVSNAKTNLIMQQAQKMNRVAQNANNLNVIMAQVLKNLPPNANNKAKANAYLKARKNQFNTNIRLNLKPNKNRTPKYKSIFAEVSKTVLPSAPPSKNEVNKALSNAIANVNKLTANSNMATINAKRNALKNAVEKAAKAGVLNSNARSKAAFNKITKMYENKVNKNFIPENAAKQAFASEKNAATKKVSNIVWNKSIKHWGGHGIPLAYYFGQNSAQSIANSIPQNLRQGLSYNSLNSALSNRVNITSGNLNGNRKKRAREVFQLISK